MARRAPRHIQTVWIGKLRRIALGSGQHQKHTVTRRDSHATEVKACPSPPHNGPDWAGITLQFLDRSGHELRVSAQPGPFGGMLEQSQPSARQQAWKCLRRAHKRRLGHRHSSLIEDALQFGTGGSRFGLLRRVVGFAGCGKRLGAQLAEAIPIGSIGSRSEDRHL
jgi:hypothetical protein